MGPNVHLKYLIIKKRAKMCKNLHFKFFLDAIQKRASSRPMQLKALLYIAILGVLPKISFKLTQSIHVALQKSYNFDLNQKNY